MSNVGLLAMFYPGSDVFALTDKHVAPIYFIRLNMKDVLGAPEVIFPHKGPYGPVW